MAMTTEEKKIAQRVYQQRYQRSAKGKLAAQRKMAKGQPWRRQFDDRLKETREISQAAGRTRDVWTPEEDAELRRMRQTLAMSYRDIALTLARSQQAIQRRADKLDLPERRVKIKAPKPLVVHGIEVDRITVEELLKFMRRRKKFTAAEARAHLLKKFGKGDDSEAFRTIDNLLRREQRAGRIDKQGRTGNVVAWAWIEPDPLP